MKFYWNTAPFIHLYTVYDCFVPQRQKWVATSNCRYLLSGWLYGKSSSTHVLSASPTLGVLVKTESNFKTYISATQVAPNLSVSLHMVHMPGTLPSITIPWWDSKQDRRRNFKPPKLSHPYFSPRVYTPEDQAQHHFRISNPHHTFNTSDWHG